MSNIHDRLGLKLPGIDPLHGSIGKQSGGFDINEASLAGRGATRTQALKDAQRILDRSSFKTSNILRRLTTTYHSERGLINPTSLLDPFRYSTPTRSVFAREMSASTLATLTSTMHAARPDLTLSGVVNSPTLRDAYTRVQNTQILKNFYTTKGLYQGNLIHDILNQGTKGFTFELTGQGGSGQFYVPNFQQQGLVLGNQSVMLSKRMLVDNKISGPQLLDAKELTYGALNEAVSPGSASNINFFNAVGLGRAGGYAATAGGRSKAYKAARQNIQSLLQYEAPSNINDFGKFINPTGGWSDHYIRNIVVDRVLASRVSEVMSKAHDVFRGSTPGSLSSILNNELLPVLRNRVSELASQGINVNYLGRESGALEQGELMLGATKGDFIPFANIQKDIRTARQQSRLLMQDPVAVTKIQQRRLAMGGVSYSGLANTRFSTTASQMLGIKQTGGIYNNLDETKITVAYAANDKAFAMLGRSQEALYASRSLLDNLQYKTKPRSPGDPTLKNARAGTTGFVSGKKISFVNSLDDDLLGRGIFSLTDNRGMPIVPDAFTSMTAKDPAVFVKMFESGLVDKAYRLAAEGKITKQELKQIFKDYASNTGRRLVTGKDLERLAGRDKLSKVVSAAGVEYPIDSPQGKMISSLSNKVHVQVNGKTHSFDPVMFMAGDASVNAGGDIIPGKMFDDADAAKFRSMAAKLRLPVDQGGSELAAYYKGLGQLQSDLGVSIEDFKAVDESGAKFYALGGQGLGIRTIDPESMSYFVRGDMEGGYWDFFQSKRGFKLGSKHVAFAQMQGYGKLATYFDDILKMSGSDQVISEALNAIGVDTYKDNTIQFLSKNTLGESTEMALDEFSHKYSEDIVNLRKMKGEFSSNNTIAQLIEGVTDTDLYRDLSKGGMRINSAGGSAYLPAVGAFKKAQAGALDDVITQIISLVTNKKFLAGEEDPITRYQEAMRSKALGKDGFLMSAMEPRIGGVSYDNIQFYATDQPARLTVGVVEAASMRSFKRQYGKYGKGISKDDYNLAKAERKKLIGSIADPNSIENVVVLDESRLKELTKYQQKQYLRKGYLYAYASRDPEISSNIFAMSKVVFGKSGEGVARINPAMATFFHGDTDFDTLKSMLPQNAQGTEAMAEAYNKFLPHFQDAHRVVLARKHNVEFANSLADTLIGIGKKLPTQEGSVVGAIQQAFIGDINVMLNKMSVPLLDDAMREMASGKQTGKFLARGATETVLLGMAQQSMISFKQAADRGEKVSNLFDAIIDVAQGNSKMLDLVDGQWSEGYEAIVRGSTEALQKSGVLSGADTTFSEVIDFANAVSEGASINSMKGSAGYKLFDLVRQDIGTIVKERGSDISEYGRQFRMERALKSGDNRFGQVSEALRQLAAGTSGAEDARKAADAAITPKLGAGPAKRKLLQTMDNAAGFIARNRQLSAVVGGLALLGIGAGMSNNTVEPTDEAVERAYTNRASYAGRDSYNTHTQQSRLEFLPQEKVYNDSDLGYYLEERGYMNRINGPMMDSPQTAIIGRVPSGAEYARLAEQHETSIFA